MQLLSQLVKLNAALLSFGLVLQQTIHPSAAYPPSPWKPSVGGPQIAPSPQMSLPYRIESYTSAVLGGDRTYAVVLPPDYARHPERRYPVIFLLHGGHGTALDWIRPDRGNAVITLEKLYAENKLPPSIVISPDGNDKRGTSPYWDPDYFDGPNGNVSTAIGEELVSVVQQRYRTLNDPRLWAIGGLSSGGWGAVNIGLHHSNHFSVMFSHSGYFEDKSGPQNSPMQLIRVIPAPLRQQFRIYLDAGYGDGHYLTETQKFHRVLAQLQVVNEFHAFPGSHSWRFWRQHLADSLTFVGHQFRSAGSV